MPIDQIIIKQHIHTYPNWPQQDTQFRDLSPLYNNNKAVHQCVNALVERYLDTDITHVAILEARAFVIGSILANKLNKPIILVRKGGKLPGKVEAEHYQTKGGERNLEIQIKSCPANSKVLIFDDLIATGHSTIATSMIIQRLNAQVVEVASIVTLPDAKGINRLLAAGLSVFSLCSYES